MTKQLVPVWIIGFLLAMQKIIPASCEEKVKRQLNKASPLTYSSIPKTSFSCDLVGPGYYADMETQCQIFHVCHANRMDSFICPTGTMFNQRVFVCDWGTNVDCDSSPDFYSLNSRIGSDEPFHSSVFLSVAERVTGGSTIATADGSTRRVARIGVTPDGQLGSPSQARVKTIRPDIVTGKIGNKVDVTRNIRFGNTLLPSVLLVEVPTFIARETETNDRLTTESSEVPAKSANKSPVASVSIQNVLTRRKEGEKQQKNQSYGSRLREEESLPASRQEPDSTTNEEDAYLPQEGSGEDPSSERGEYLPTEVSNTVSSNSYLPEETPESRSTPSRGSYLPGEGTEEPDSSNFLSEKPSQPAVTDTSFLLTPPSSPELPNSILAAFSFQIVDEHSPEPPTTVEPSLPPMDLLTLSNESAPSTEDGRLPSTTDSDGVLDEEGAGSTARPTAPTRSRQGFGRALRRRPKVSGQGKNAVQKKTTKRPATETPTPSAVPEFQYNFDRVRNALQERLRNVEPFDVPAETAATSVGTTVAPSSGSTRTGGAAMSPWLFALSKLSL